MESLGEKEGEEDRDRERERKGEILRGRGKERVGESEMDKEEEGGRSKYMNYISIFCGHITHDLSFCYSLLSCPKKIPSLPPSLSLPASLL